MYILCDVKREYEQCLIAGGSNGIYMSSCDENFFFFLSIPSLNLSTQCINTKVVAIFSSPDKGSIDRSSSRWIRP